MKVENDQDDEQLSARSARSKRPPSVTSSKRGQAIKNRLALNKDLAGTETKSKFETNSLNDKKENLNNINNSSLSNT